MKIVYAFLFCFVAAVLADDEEDPKITKAINECRKEFGIENKDSAEIAKTTLTTEYKSACFAFCMEKKQGRMNEDGTYNKAAIYKVVDPLRKTEFENRLAFCEKKIVPVDGCKMAGCLHSGEVPTDKPLNE